MNKRTMRPREESPVFFAKAGTQVFPVSQVVLADFSRIEELKVRVELSNGRELMLSDIDAIEFALATKPSVLESRRLRWPRFAWAVHNLVGHPLMQLLAFVKAYRLAFLVHDGTVPRPVGRREPRQPSSAATSGKDA